jgi:hypothetical protein
MSTELLIAPPFNLLHIDISQDADWNDPFQVVDANGDPYDLTGAILELYVRPRFAHDTLFRKLSSVATAGIVIDGPGEGMAHFFLDRATILADFPISSDDGWQQFMVLTEGTVQTELWRGQFRVFPGIIAA